MLDQQSPISGLGLMTCEEFLAAKQADHWTYEANLQWILGYATAMNQVAPLMNQSGRFGEDLEWEPIALWLEQYSLANPDDLVADAAARLYSEFGSQQQTVH